MYKMISIHNIDVGKRVYSHFWDHIDSGEAIRLDIDFKYIET